MKRFPLPFSEFHVDQEFVTPHRTVSAEEIDRFAELSEDHNPLHRDREFARSTRFGTVIAHGAFTFSILTGLWDRAGFMSGTVEAFVAVDRLRFLLPVRAGDELHARVRVLATSPKASGGVIVLDHSLSNQRDEAVLSCQTTLLIRADRPSIRSTRSPVNARPTGRWRAPQPAEP